MRIVPLWTLPISSGLEIRSPPEGIDINNPISVTWTRAYWENTAVAHPGVVRSPFLQLNYATYFRQNLPAKPGHTAQQ